MLLFAAKWKETKCIMLSKPRLQQMGDLPSSFSVALLSWLKLVPFHQARHSPQTHHRISQGCVMTHTL